MPRSENRSLFDSLFDARGILCALVTT